LTTRCAIYARYSSDMQRPTSIEDQVRRCRNYAEQRGWTVLDGFVLSDRAISGGSIENRPALQHLLKAVQEKPRPFDRILIDDTSRLSRDAGDALKTQTHLSYFGVHLNFVSQGIDTAHEASRPVTVMQAIMDEQYAGRCAIRCIGAKKGALWLDWLPVAVVTDIETSLSKMRRGVASTVAMR
jgi:site-specific DNA recombinase